MEDNIFEISKKGSKSGKGGPIPEKKIQRVPLDVSKHDTAISEMFEKMHHMKNDLETKLASVYQQGKEKHVTDMILLDNVNNLTKQQMKELQEQENVLMNQIREALPPESCMRGNPKSKEKLTQERQGKMRGARNKWIPVR